MLEVQVPLQAGETMIALRERARGFCETSRISFHQGGQIQGGLVLLVTDQATREVVEKGLCDGIATIADAEPSPTVPQVRATPSEDSEPRERQLRGTLKPSSS